MRDRGRSEIDSSRCRRCQRLSADEFVGCSRWPGRYVGRLVADGDAIDVVLVDGPDLAVPDRAPQGWINLSGYGYTCQFHVITTIDFQET